ncbi:MAG: phosphoribosyl-AMP cyclohydrolase [Pseudomonadota bacterium]
MKSIATMFSVFSALVLIMTSALAIAQGLTEADIKAAQKAWGDALVAIAVAYDTEGEDSARELAIEAVERYYNHGNGAVLFKPTLAAEPQRFRTTREGAIAYFVGGDPNFPDDNGFALEGWREVDVTNAAIFIDGNIGMSMGDVTITDADGKSVSVDKTWGFQKLENGEVVIVLHHSSLPFTR